METFDKIQRRNRFEPQSTGKRVSLKPRDLRWLEALRDHGPLPSHYLHAFTDTTHQSAKASRIRLTDLASETHTPHNGVYLTRPAAQRSGANVLNRSLVYDLSKAGWKALDAPKSEFCRPTGPFPHQLMVSTVTASIELSCLKSSSMRYIPGWQILARAGASLSVETAIKMPQKRKTERHRLVPDQLFAIEFTKCGKKSYLAFLVECDRGTEPVISASPARKSYLRNYLQYREFVGSGHYKEKYGLNTSCLVINVMSSEGRQKRYMDLIQKQSPNGNSYMLFQTIENFGAFFQPPPIMSALVDQEWVRVKKPPTIISRI